MSEHSDDDGGETCQRCGEKDYDRRTLWMACFYQMNEMREVPYGQVAIRGKVCEPDGVERFEDFLGSGRAREFPKWRVPDDAKESDRIFYTLRVCKECRADWMRAIASWFAASRQDEATGTGAYIREQGGIREMTEAEIAQRFPKGGEVRVRKFKSR